jgi:predicted dehydrogenase
VNAGPLPAGHWLNDPAVGGGRMIGEGCHFVDLISYLAGDPGIRAVDARSAGRARRAAEDLAVQVELADGSVGQLLYTARGAPSLGKERIEAHAGGCSAVIDDFRTCTIHLASGRRSVRQAGKGHGDEMAALLAAVRAGGPPPIPLPVLLDVTRATFRVHDVLAGQPEAAAPAPARTP